MIKITDTSYEVVSLTLKDFLNPVLLE